MVWLGFYPFLFSAGLAGVSLLAGGVVLLLALWLDRRFGEPPVAIHPVVWMGNYLKACGRVTVRWASGRETELKGPFAVGSTVVASEPAP